MGTFVEKTKTTQATPPKTTTRTRSHFEHSHEVHSIVHLQRTSGNQDVQLEANTRNAKGESAHETTRFGHDFSRIAVHASAPMTFQPMAPPGTNCKKTSMAQEEHDREACWKGDLPPTVMPKLKIGAANDPRERVADRIAERVMDGTLGTRFERKEEEEELLKAKASDVSGEVSSTQESLIKVAREGGQHLPPEIREELESRLGADFSDVRIHIGEKSEAAAKWVGARAFTVGRDVVFGAGEYSPASTEGKKLLAHEMAHVVQQNNSGQVLLQRVEDPANVMLWMFGKPPKNKTISPSSKQRRELYRYLKTYRQEKPERKEYAIDAMKEYFNELGANNVWEESKKPLAGYEGYETGPSSGGKASMFNKEDSLGMDKTEAQGSWQDKVRGADVFFFSGHAASRENPGSLTGGKSLWGMKKQPATKVKLVIMSACNQFIKSGPSLLNEVFPNALLLGWAVKAPDGETILRRFLNSLPEDQKLGAGSESGLVSRFKSYIEGELTPAKYPSIWGAPVYMKSDGSGQAYKRQSESEYSWTPLRS